MTIMVTPAAEGTDRPNTTGAPKSSAVTLRPGTTDEVRQAVLDTAVDRPRLLIRGAGSADGWGAGPGPIDAVVDTTALHGILQYNPADLTLAVRAGTPLADVQAEVAEHGQWVALDPARASEGATVGGLLATADGGPSRLAHGTLRELIIGVTVVLADGTVAHSGGHVIKNVAGYDLGKLFHGSFGTLGAVTEVVLRLHPTPRAVTTVAVDVAPAQAYAVGTAVASAGIEPTALELLCRDGLTQMLIRLHGTEHGVGERSTAVAELVAHPTRMLTADEADVTWTRLRTLSVGEPGDTVLRMGSLPSHGVALLDLIKAVAAEAGIKVDSTSTLMTGVHTVRLRGGAEGSHDAVLRAVHNTVGSACTVLRRDGLAPDTPLWGPAPPAVSLMRAVKARFDPHDRFDSTRLAPWLATSSVRTEQLT